MGHKVVIRVIVFIIVAIVVTAGVILVMNYIGSQKRKTATELLEKTFTTSMSDFEAYDNSSDEVLQENMTIRYQKYLTEDGLFSATENKVFIGAYEAVGTVHCGMKVTNVKLTDKGNDRFSYTVTAKLDDGTNYQFGGELTVLHQGFMDFPVNSITLTRSTVTA